MRRLLVSLIISLGFGVSGTKPGRAYDMDCAIMLCMAGGFPSSSVCAAAYAEMIRRITPWPVRPPFGVCTFAAVPVELGGPGGEPELDISIPEYAWLRKTRVLWLSGRSYEERGGPRLWDWSIRSCDHENRNCRQHVSVHASPSPWPASFVSENGQSISFPNSANGYNYSYRAVMVEFGDYGGLMDHSEWKYY